MMFVRLIPAPLTGLPFASRVFVSAYISCFSPRTPTSRTTRSKTFHVSCTKKAIEVLCVTLETIASWNRFGSAGSTAAWPGRVGSA